MAKLKGNEFKREVRRLCDMVDDNFGVESTEGLIIKADIENKLSRGIPYLEKVNIEKKGENKYEGSVTIGDKKSATVRFSYESRIPISLIDKITEQNGIDTIGDKKEFAKKMLKISIKKASGEEISENAVKSMIIEYIQGSVPYAIAYLERQIRISGEAKGTFSIPRTMSEH